MTFENAGMNSPTLDKAIKRSVMHVMCALLLGGPTLEGIYLPIT